MDEETPSWTELGMKELWGQRSWEKYPRKCRNGHVSRREEEYVGKRVMVMEVPGKRRESKAEAEVVG